MNHEVSTREELFADPDEIVAFAQAYYATEFPNSARHGCPSADTLRKVACSGILPDVELRAHLFNCSECFRSFRSVRISYRPRVVAKEMWWQVLHGLLSSIVSRRALITAGAMSLILFGIITGLMLMWNAHKEEPKLAMNNSSQTSPVPPEGSTASPASNEPKTVASPAYPKSNSTASRPKLPPQRAQALIRKSRPASAMRVIEINLNDEALLRGADDSNAAPRIINLAPERQRLRLRLPDGNRSGRYTVSIVDAFGKSLVTVGVNSNGRTLTVDLDLRDFMAKKYRLVIARAGEAPDYYLININNQTSRVVR